MATSEQVVDEPVPGTGVVGSVIAVGATLVGTATTLAFFAYRKVSFAVFGSAVASLKAVRLAPVIQRFPTASSVLGVAVGLAAAPFGDRVFAAARPTPSTLAACAAFWLSTGVLMIATEVLCMPPGRIDAVREAIGRRFPERWFAGVLAEPLDAIFVRVAINNSLLVIPAVVAIALHPRPSPLTWVLCFLGQRVCARVHEAMDHANLHNHVFHPRRDAPPLARALCHALGLYQAYPLNVAMGRIPRWYAIQHLAVHHAEDGSLDDNQTTVLRDRTSFLQYCAASTSWLLSQLFAVDVARYLFVRGRRKLLRSLLLHVAGYHLFLVLLGQVSWPAALFLLLARAFPVPDAVITQYNWHGFVDTRQFANTYRNTVHIASTAELGFLGLNAHLQHHLHAAGHWSELAPAARRDEARYRAEGVAVLRANGRERTRLLRLLFERRFEELGGEFAAIGDAPREDFASILEERTRPLVPRRWSRALESIDRALSVAFARALL